jgi:hypothetical protein
MAKTPKRPPSLHSPGEPSFRLRYRAGGTRHDPVPVLIISGLVNMLFCNSLRRSGAMVERFGS